jgi:hypothetical protein
MNEKTGLWMYCIIENQGEMRWDCLGIHGTSPVLTVSGGGFTAVVSEEPMKKYPLVRDYLIAHQRVNEVAMQGQPVLPVKFCTLAESREKIIEEVLIPKAAEFRESLAEIHGKEEYGLRARWKDLDKVFREIGETDEKVRRKKEMILNLPEQQRRTELIDIGHLVQAAVQEKNEKTAQALVDELTPLAVSFKKNNTLGDAMVLNAAFLVEKKRQEAFDRKINELDSRYREALQFKYVGPVPPFNFVEIVIEWKEETPSPVSASGGATLSLEGEGGRRPGEGAGGINVPLR